MTTHVRLIGLLGGLLAIGAMAPLTVSAAGPVEARYDSTPGGTTPALQPVAIDVLANDAPGVASASRPLTITKVTQGAHGTVTTDGRTVVYNPSGCYAGVDQFSYTLTDGATSDVGQVIFTVAHPTTAPTTDVPSASFVNGRTIGSAVPLLVRWCGVATGSAAVSGYRLAESTNGGGSWSVAFNGTSTAAYRNVRPATNTLWEVRTTDTRKVTGDYTKSLLSRITSYQDNGGRITYSSGWKTTSSRKYSGGKDHYVARTGATATLANVTNVRQFAIVASRGKGRGSFYVYVDGKRVTSAISQRSAKADFRRILYVGSIPGNTAGPHTIQVRTANGSRIDLDTILTLSGRQTPAITFTNPAPVGKTYGDTPYAAGASTTSGLPLTLAVKPTSWTACSLAGTTVTFHGTGTCALDATIAADPSWNAVTSTRTFTVAPAPLTVTGITAQNRAFDGTTDATLVIGSPTLVGVRAGDEAAVTLNTSGATASFASAGAGVDKPITVSGLILTGAKASLYRVIPPTLAATIDKAAQAITFNPANEPTAAVKDGPPYVVRASATSGLPVTLTVNASSTGVCTLAGDTVSFPGFGVCEIDAEQPGDANWNPESDLQSFTVASTGTATQTITFDPIGNATYGDGPRALAASASSGLPVTLTATTPGVCGVSGASVVILAAGTCTVEAAQAGNSTYAPATVVSRTLTIATLGLTVTGVTAAGRQYDATTIAALDTTGAVLVGVVGTDDVNLDRTNAVGAFAGANAGSNKPVTITGLALIGVKAGSYSLTQPSATATISKAPLSVTADSHAITYGDPDPAFTFAYGTFVPGETSAVLDTAPTCSVAGASRDVSGSPFAITCSGGADVNYAFSYTAGTLTVNAKSVAVSFTVSNRPYDGTTNATITACTPAAIEAGDAVTCAFGSATAAFDTPDVGAGKTVTGAGFTLAGPDAGNYAIGTINTSTADITLAPQVIAFTSTAPDPATAAGATYAVTATGGGSGNPVTFTSATTGVCTITTATVTFLTEGTCTIHANQAGNAAHAAAGQATQDVNVVRHAQSITFNLLGTRTYGDLPFTVSATVSSPLAVTFESQTTSVCTTSGTTVTLVGAGACTIRASQAGNSTYEPADDVDRPFTVNKADQTVAFVEPAPADASVGGSATQTATASSGLIADVTVHATSTPGSCSLSGSTVSFDAAGTCVLAANQGGDTSWNAAPPVLRSFAISLAPQAISFTDPADATYGDALGLAATATSGLTVTFATQTPLVCTVAGATATTVATGTCTVRATQGGNATYAPAPHQDQSFTVGTRAITVTAVTASKVADGTTSAAGTPTLTGGTLAPGDTASFSQSFDTAAAGTGKTLIPTGTVDHGGPDVTTSYAITWINDTTGTITPAAASLATSTITASPASLTGDGSTTSDITVVLRDAHGNALTASGGLVTLSVTGPGTVGPVTDNADGTYSATYTSAIVGAPATAEIGGALDAQALADGAMVTLTP